MGLKSFLKKRIELEEKDQTKIATKIYNVVGVTFEGRQSILEKYFIQYKKSGKRRECQLILDNENKFDSNAIAVMICGSLYPECVGFISKDQNVELRKRFADIYRIKVNSMGVTETGIIGLTIKVEFEN